MCPSYGFGQTFVDTLEDIGPDYTPVTSRTIGGLTVNISTATGLNMSAATYDDTTPQTFYGGPLPNHPLVPENVSGSRFISTSDFANPNGRFHIIQPIIFTFSEPVYSFGLTSLDLLEPVQRPGDYLTLTAYDASGNVVDTHTRFGDQGDSGVDLDWYVSSLQGDIVRAEFGGLIYYGVGYGIDDLVIGWPVIDIKPGSYPNSINLGSNGVVPVAILSSPAFDATTVDPETVELSGAGVAMRGKGNKYLAHEEDVNGDGLTDLVCQVETENLDPGQFQDGYAVLTGLTFLGEEIEGVDEIEIVPPQ
ncbi:MAG: hypothetical protein ACYTG0_15330 [Planctomycetota bacterium]